MRLRELRGWLGRLFGLFSGKRRECEFAEELGGRASPISTLVDLFDLAFDFDPQALAHAMSFGDSRTAEAVKGIFSALKRIKSPRRVPVKLCRGNGG